MGRLRSALGVHARGPDDARVRDSRGRVPALGLLFQRGRGPLVDDHADVLQDDRAVVLTGGLAAAVGVAAVAVVEPRAVPDARQGARDRALRDRDPARLRHLLLVADGVLRKPVRDHLKPARRGRRPGSAAASPQHDDPPADAVFGVHAADDPVRVRGGRADHGQARLGVDRGGPAVRSGRVAVSRDRDPARRPLVLHGAGMGWLLGLGSG